jgi:hypothetical protein
MEERDPPRGGGAVPAGPVEGRRPSEDLKDLDLLANAKKEDQNLGAAYSRPWAIENLSTEAAGGAASEPGGHGSALGSLGVNFGTAAFEKQRIGVQVGATMAKRKEDKLDGAITTGLSIRDLGRSQAVKGGAALLADFLRTTNDTTLFGLRGFTGLTLRRNDHLGASGVLPFYRKGLKEDDPTAGREHLLARSDFLWGHEFTEQIGTEASAGYLYGDVETFVFGGRVSAVLFPNWSVTPAGEVDLHSHYAFGVHLVYDLSGQSRSSMLTRFGSQRKEDYTPFRKMGFSQLLLETRRR